MNLTPALIVIDGKIYNGSIEDLNPNAIASYDVLNGQAAINLYGAQAANGCIVIVTKKGSDIFSGRGTKKKATETESSHGTFTGSTLPDTSALPVFIIDGKRITDSISYGVMKGTSPDDILEINVLKDTAETAIYGSKAKRNGVVIMTTKAYSKKSYQDKFGVFSEQYKTYLIARQYNDDNFHYLLNGVVVKGASQEKSSLLYRIPADKIESLFFNGTPDQQGFVMVIIKTQQ